MLLPRWSVACLALIASASGCSRGSGGEGGVAQFYTLRTPERPGWPGPEEIRRRTIEINAENSEREARELREWKESLAKHEAEIERAAREREAERLASETRLQQVLEGVRQEFREGRRPTARGYLRHSAPGYAQAPQGGGTASMGIERGSQAHDQSLSRMNQQMQAEAQLQYQALMHKHYGQ